MGIMVVQHLSPPSSAPLRSGLIFRRVRGALTLSSASSVLDPEADRGRPARARSVASDQQEPVAAGAERVAVKPECDGVAPGGVGVRQATDARDQRAPGAS